jgi:hypothetical protein
MVRAGRQVSACVSLSPVRTGILPGLFINQFKSETSTDHTCQFFKCLFQLRRVRSFILTIVDIVLY